MDLETQSKFQSELMKDEKIHWSGKPDPSVLFNGSDFFLVPFSLLWGGFAVFWEMSVLGLIGFGKQSTHAHPPVFFALWGIPFVLMGCYMVFGRFFYKAWRKGRTYYAITNQRVIIISELRRRQVNALFLNQTAAINRSAGSNGRGTLVFGNTSFSGSIYGNSGMEFFGSRYGSQVFAFYDVPEVEGVYQLVNQLRAKA